MVKRIKRGAGRHPAKTTWRRTVLLSLLSLLPETWALAYDMDQHLWKARVLVLAAPSAEDPGLLQQRRAIDARRDALIDRDLRVFELAGDSGRLDGEALDAGAANALRSQFALAQDARLLILIGLDGGIKRRESIDIDLSEVFRQIDGMPMRRADIRAKKAAGLPVTKP